MAARYQVRIRDHAGVQVALLTDWSNLQYTRRVNAPGDHALLLNGLAPVVALMEVDYQVEVWRRDIAAVPAIPWYLDYEGFHRTGVDQTTERGQALYTSYGRGYDDLLARRSVLYPSGSAGADKSGPGETVMKAFVSENAGPGATAPSRLFDGVTAGLTVEADGAAGMTFDGSRAYRGLLEVVQEIALATGVDFAVVGTGPGTFQFQAKAFPFGEDRTTTGLNPATGLNAAGNAPVVFSLGFGNMGSAVLSDNRSEEVNAVIMLGQGLEADREVVQRIVAGAVAASPWNRREATRNASQESTTAGLESAGDALLEELQARESFSFEVVQTPASLYGRNYAVSDTITARYKTVERNYQITAATITVAEGRETIRLEVNNVS